MKSPSAVLLGSQVPRLLVSPPRASSAGQEAVELAATAGLILDPWQSLALNELLAERPDGKWAAFEAGLIVPRQNGKGSVLEALELAGLILFGERLILHTAHEYKTAAEAFLRVQSLLENTDDLRKKVSKVRTANGEQGIEMKSGQRLRFIARSAGSGRGFSGDRIILDEAYNLPLQTMQALLPTMAARPNPQIVYASSAGDSTSVHLASVRERALSGRSARLSWCEWSVDQSVPADPDDRAGWAQANPALGRRISDEFVEAERAAMSSDVAGFSRERLGWWDSSPGGMSIISAEVWAMCLDADSQALDPVALAFDVSPDRSTASIAIAGTRADGLAHLEVIDCRPGTDWLVPRLTELQARHRPMSISFDPAGPAGSIAADARSAGLTLTEVSMRDHAAACGALFDSATNRTLRHLGQPQLSAALAGAAKRPLGESWAWSRKHSGVDISPLVAATLAFGARRSQPKRKPTFAF